MTEHYLDRLARTIRENWDSPALTDFYLTEDGTAQDTSRGNHYTYGEMYQEICRVAAMLECYGLKRGDHIAICGSNSANWVIAYLAIAKMQGVSVTIMHTLMPDEIARQVEFADCKALFIDSNLWQQLVVKDSCPLYMVTSVNAKNGSSSLLPTLTHVIALDDFLNLQGLPIKPFPISKNILDKYRRDNICFPRYNTDDLAQICFTSGTGGKYKGVRISNSTLSFIVKSKEDVLQYLKKYGIDYVSFLPYAHIFGVTEEMLRILCGGLHNHIVCNQHSVCDLYMCYQLVKPVYIVTVPSVLEYVISRAKRHPKNEQKLVYMQSFGGNLRETFVSGALMSLENIRYLMDLKVPFSTSYGMTEAPLTTFCLTNEYKLETAGILTKGIDCKISPEGEILVKGENVMLGYYKDPEATAQKIDADGWLHTGDRGHIDEYGYLYVEGRMEQDIIVLPNGENIRPEDIEQKLNALQGVEESVVVARDGKLVALVRLAERDSTNPNNQNNQSNQNTPTIQTTFSTLKEQRQRILRQINPQLPLFSQLYDVEFLTAPIARTAKQNIKRYLYK